jgi:hypothetical protein
VEVMKEQYWTTKDGRKIAVGDMTLEHLRNVLRMLIREDRITFDLDDKYDYLSAGEWWKE